MIFILSGHIVNANTLVAPSFPIVNANTLVAPSFPIVNAKHTCCSIFSLQSCCVATTMKISICLMPLTVVAVNTSRSTRDTEIVPQV